MKEITGKRALAILLAFFGIMFAANGVFVYFATSTFSGVSTENAYKKGLDYNKEIAAHTEQKASGWHARVWIKGERVFLQIRNADDLPVEGLIVRGILGRPATSQFDQTVVLQEQQDGTYASDAQALPEGQWLLQVEARSGRASDAPPYKVTERLWQKL